MHSNNYNTWVNLGSFMTGEMPWWCYGNSWRGRSRKLAAAKLCSTQTLIHIHAYTCVYTYTGAYIYIMHTYIHTHTHTTTHQSKVLDPNVSVSWWVLVSATRLCGGKNPRCAALANTPDPSCAVSFPALSPWPPDAEEGTEGGEVDLCDLEAGSQSHAHHRTALTRG